MEDYTPGWNFEGSSFTVKTEKIYNLDGVADTLHHISPLSETGLWKANRVLAGRWQPDLRIRGFLGVVEFRPRCSHTKSHKHQLVNLPGHSLSHSKWRRAGELCARSEFSFKAQASIIFLSVIHFRAVLSIFTFIKSFAIIHLKIFLYWLQQGF